MICLCNLMDPCKNFGILYFFPPSLVLNLEFQKKTRQEKQHSSIEHVFSMV